MKVFFRKLRILDYLIIIAFILVIVIFYRFFNPERRWVEMLVIAENLPSFQVEALHAGDFEKDSSGKPIAEVLDLAVYDTPQAAVSNNDVYLNLKLLMDVNPRSQELEYKNKIMKVGSQIELLFNSGRVNGKVAALGQEKPSLESKVVTLELYEQWPWFADSIKAGEGQSDASGQKIVDILSVEAKLAEITVTTASGETLVRTDPRKRDLTIRAKMQVRRFGDDLILGGDQRIIVGEIISFNVGQSRIKNALIAAVE